MAIAKVNITEQNGQLGGLVTTKDGVSGLVISGVATTASGEVVSTSLNEPFQVFGISDDKLVQHDISLTGTNAFAYKVIKEFYDAAREGTELWVVLTQEKHENLFNVPDNTHPGPAQLLVDSSMGKVRLVGVSIEYSNGDGIEDDSDQSDGFSSEVAGSISNANAFAKRNTEAMNPLVVILDGKSYSPGDDLTDLVSGTNHYVQVMLGSLSSNTKNAAVGYAVGYSATLPVQRKKSRVKNGALPNVSEAYFTNRATTESLASNWASIGDKGYLFFITRQGKSGYFFSSDDTSAHAQDDFNTLPKRRVMNKAIELTYTVFVEHLDDEVPVSDGGTIDPAYAAYLEGLMDNQLNQIMVASGEASGARTTVDTSSDILSENTTNVSIEIQPVGYNETISVTVGFTKQLN